MNKTDQFKKYSGKKDAVLGKVKINEPSDKCCMVIPLELGVKILGVFTILGFVASVSHGVSLLSLDLIMSVLTLVCALPQFLASVLFVKYFMDPKKKEDLPDAMFYTFLSSIALPIVTTILGFRYAIVIGTIISAAVTVVISYLFSAYYYGVVKRYAE